MRNATKPTDDDVIAAVRSRDNRAHTVSVWLTLANQHGDDLSRSWVLARLHYLRGKGRVRNLDTSYKVALIWSAT